MLKRRILFLCATNGLHSPMAEALLTRIDSQNFEAISAGTTCGQIHPLTLQVMNEIGIDLARKQTRSIEELKDADFDYVITLGDRAVLPQHSKLERAEV